MEISKYNKLEKLGFTFWAKRHDDEIQLESYLIGGSAVAICSFSNLGFNLIERYILPKEINEYDEVFLTGTAAEITPIKSIDNINYNVGNNTITFDLMNDFTNLVNNSL